MPPDRCIALSHPQVEKGLELAPDKHRQARDGPGFGLSEERLEMFPHQTMQDRLLRPPSLLPDHVRRRGARHGFALQSHPDANARTTIAGRRDSQVPKNANANQRPNDRHSKGVEDEMSSLASRDR